ncbi:NAD(P)H-quinone oxidoreductase subunit J [Prochlorococcus marinus]|uniref:NAD(P)H-quinone oxidoreductase subunit J n=1 Tax=Prochlorococcus marinus TaxID=1219 RepID=UPI0022B4059B|nr:NAD(P)H-quinone oxidoreductase subunit J [Prochlorococcus marinus]
MTNESEIVVEEKISGPISDWLSKNGFENIPLQDDHLGVEVIKITPKNILSVVEALKNDGFNYLQCQGGYDEGPGLNIVCFYNLIEMNEFKKDFSPREVRLKVFLDRDGDLNVPSLYSLFRGADWQERETFDMYGVNFTGHPHPKRLLMPEDWKGWPLRKDYVQPDFYEMQDAY